MAGAPVAWGSKKQLITATSSAESEYVSLASCCKEVMALRNLLSQLPCGTPSTATMVYEDNQSCINMVKNPKGWKHTKHIDVRLHFVRDLSEAGLIKLQHVTTDKQVADALTKPLGLTAFPKFRDRMLGLLASADFE